MAEVHVLDDYYLAITLLITVAYQLFFFAIAYSLKFDKLTDFAGGTNFVVLAIITLAFSGHHHARQIVASLLIMVWGARLSAFLLFRIVKTGKDDRFDDKRENFFKFLGFWVFQMVWVWTVSLPITLLNSPNVTKYPQPQFGLAGDILGIVIFAIGLLMETVADAQKFRFRSKNPERKTFISSGLFAWSRHPNYFGEIILHFGLYLLCIPPASHNYVRGGAKTALLASIACAIFLIVLLLFVSGLPLQERPSAKKRYENNLSWDAYARYLQRTSVLIPFPPAVYARLPVFLKRTIFLEFPIYVFDPAKHSDRPARVPGEAGRNEELPSTTAKDGNVAEGRQSGEGLV